MAQRAINAVLAGTSACLRARNNHWLRTMLSAEIFRRTEFSSEDYWPFPVDLKPLVYECRTCCGRLFSNDKNKEPVPPKPQQDYSKYVYSTQRQEERKIKEFKLKDSTKPSATWI